jgi:hypothetical protein
MINAANSTTSPYVTFIFVIDNIDLKTGDMLELVEYKVGKTNAAMAEYNEIRGSGGQFEIVSPLTGLLQVLNFDPMKKIFSGTFSFDGINNAGKSVSIKDGRFDLKLH